MNGFSFFLIIFEIVYTSAIALLFTSLFSINMLIPREEMSRMLAAGRQKEADKAHEAGIKQSEARKKLEEAFNENLQAYLKELFPKSSKNYGFSLYSPAPGFFKLSIDVAEPPENATEREKEEFYKKNKESIDALTHRIEEATKKYNA